VIQVALALLGPGDPNVDPSSMLLRARPFAKFQFDSQICVLAASAVSLMVEWKDRDLLAPQSFDRVCVLLDQMLVGTGFILFWFCSARRRTMASKVLLHIRFWQRILCLALPVFLMVVLAALCSAVPTSPALQATLRIVSATVAAAAIWLTFVGCRLEIDHGADRPVAQWLLFSSAAIMAPTVLLTVASDPWEHSWRWPTLSMAGTSQIGGFVLMTAALPLVATTLLVIMLIECVPPVRSPSGMSAASRLGMKLPSLKAMHGVSCHVARLAMVFGLATALVAEKDSFGQVLHTGLAATMFCLFWCWVFLSVIGTDLATRFGKIRAAASACILLGSGIHLLLFLLANGWVTTQFGIPRALTIAYFISEYVMLGLIVTYPATWFEDVQNWQGVVARNQGV